MGVGRVARSLVLAASALVAPALVASALLRRVGRRACEWAGGRGVLSRIVVIVVVADVCGCCPGWARKFACMFVRTLLASSDAWGRLVVRQLRRRRRRRLRVCDVVCGDWLFIAALAACLCGWLIRSARHGGRRRRHGDDATRLRVCGGVFGAALSDVRLVAHRTCARV